ncbi:hypothetical protein PpBr36_06914 [Pyricularia pennisetigena]|uniref:hypothetical protein n=1 Tax=Pyricularia pennisetigena TaxID=1578925 RepID=UPI001154AF1B|nr:hypothetical protein PpBr36_06914 [Pyricularia pennisetigena]TLS25243.1 hypothetical protein PpBr36_06914 [Pyricularia pennisetigena]
MRFNQVTQALTLLCISAQAAPAAINHAPIESGGGSVSSERNTARPVWTKGAPSLKCTGCDKEYWTSSRLIRHLGATEHGAIPGSDPKDWKQYQIDYEYPPAKAGAVITVLEALYTTPLPSIARGDICSDANNADFARLLALCNAAVSGIREHPSGRGDPLFQTVGSPETNNNGISFKPPFPAYPSGHATFGAATFQMARLYYKRRDGLDFPDAGADAIALEFVSDELDGDYDASRPITEQVGTVRTRVPVRFESLWSCIHDNALSRVFLGVHWRFDAFAAEDVLVPNPSQEPGQGPYLLNPDGSTAYKPTAEVRYQARATRFDREGLFPIGGVLLGLGIADEIFAANLKPTPEEAQPGGEGVSRIQGLLKDQVVQKTLNGANGTK